MAVRHRDSAALSGIMAFPGGKIEPDDGLLAAKVGPPGPDPIDDVRTDAVAAIRETWEETGLLFARHAASGSPLGAAEIADIRARHADADGAGALPFSALLDAEGLEPDTGRLAYFARWISPDTASRRFDTRFFLAACPDDQEPVPDGREMTGGLWIGPAEALAAATSGRFELVFPTKRKLAKLAGYASVADALGRAREGRVVAVQAAVTRTETGRILRIPADAGYDGSEFVE